MDFAVRPTLSKDSTKIVLVAGNVWATVACEDIRQEFGVPDASNELLRQRASIRQTNKEALGEIAQNLFEAGRYTLLQGIHVLNISRADLAKKKDQFAWGQSDLAPVLGIAVQNPTNVAAGKFEVERSKVESLMQLLGWSNFATFDPNLERETGVDVLVQYESRRIGFQVTDFHSDEGTGSKYRGSNLRRQESKKARDGLPAAMWVKPDPIPGLMRRIEDKTRKQWSRRDFPEMYLLIAASVPEQPGIVSTFTWDPKVDLNKMNTKLSPILERSGYSAAYLYNMMQNHVYRWTREIGWEKLR
jgi:hypothetical protein